MHNTITLSLPLRYAGVALALALAAGCSNDAKGAPKIRPGYITGMVVDTQGRPLPNVQVSIYGTTFAQGQRTSFETITKADGSYSLRVPDGRYSAKASMTRDYNGHRYGFILAPVNGNPDFEVDSSEGGSIDFAWRIAGLSAYSAPPGKDYTDFYGASINMSYCGLPAKAYCDEKYGEIVADAVPGGAIVTFTLTPKGPLVDGSAGEVKRLTFEAPPLRADYPSPGGGGRLILRPSYHSFGWHDIPLGVYELTATAVLPDGSTRAFKLGAKEDDVEHASLPVEFVPWDNFKPASYIGGGLKQVTVHVRD